MSSLIVFESLAVFAIWMQRKGRWSAFVKAASGQVVVGGVDRAGGQAYTEDANGKVYINESNAKGSSTGTASQSSVQGGSTTPVTSV